jgi:uncharacterized protein YlxP (DUF503 family)
MVAGICRMTLIIHDNHSLKGKRKVLKSIIDKVRNRFNISIAEVGSNDAWQRAEIGLAAIGNDRVFINSVIDKAVNFIEGLEIAEVTDYQIELISF